MIIDLYNTNMSLQEALFSALPGDEIILDNKRYFEKIIIDKPNITIRGREASIIDWDDCNGRIIPTIYGGNGVLKYGTTTSATFRVLPEGKGFKAFNVTFMNSFERIDKKDGQAVAFKSEAFDTYIEGCKFISKQDALYMDYGSNNIIKDSYIEGDIDFIFGSADCLFLNCDIKAIKVGDNAFYTAPNTLIINQYGFIFKDCRFTTVSDINTYLIRPWYPSGAPQPVYPRLSIIDCKFYGDIEFEPIKMHKQSSSECVLKFYNTYLNDCKLNDSNCDVELKYINQII